MNINFSDQELRDFATMLKEVGSVDEKFSSKFVLTKASDLLKKLSVAKDEKKRSVESAIELAKNLSHYTEPVNDGEGYDAPARYDFGHVNLEEFLSKIL